MAPSDPSHSLSINLKYVTKLDETFGNKFTNTFFETISILEKNNKC